MVILGIDPGLATVGYGIVAVRAGVLRTVQYGTITTTAHAPQGARLRIIYDGLHALCTKYSPTAMAIEKLFFNTNVTTAFAVGAARGVMLLVADQRGLSLGEYTPMQVKQAMTGYGHADKQQVQFMVRTFLGLTSVPKPDDAADALAIAVCHAHTAQPKEG
ncbi:MAG: crossover junction endodeoxyribonuclease RuvC [Paenibacillaceae bacterium]|jgi:crossover junction endodeoxyribonuclease RuvC|nr:crossover junction endodeoxyribonuclease RuvC [Paenibacillaceae bacterium]